MKPQKKSEFKEFVEFVKEYPLPCLIALCIGLFCLMVMNRITERDNNRPVPTVKKEPAITREEGLQILWEWEKAKARANLERERKEEEEFLRNL